MYLPKTKARRAKIQPFSTYGQCNLQFCSITPCHLRLKIQTSCERKSKLLIFLGDTRYHFNFRLVETVLLREHQHTYRKECGRQVCVCLCAHVGLFTNYLPSTSTQAGRTASKHFCARTGFNTQASQSTCPCSSMCS